MKQKLLIVSLIMSSTLLLLADSEIKSKEVPVDNPSFEKQGKRNNPQGWWICRSFRKADPPVKGAYLTDGKIAHSEQCSVMITGTEKARGAWISSKIKAKGGASYKLSVWIRDQEIKDTGSAYIQLLEFNASGKHTKTSKASVIKDSPDEWKRISLKVNTLPTTKKLQIRLFTEGKGKVWFDDVSLTQMID